MATVPPDPGLTEPGRLARTLRAALGVPAQGQAQGSNKDLFEALDKAVEGVRENYPNAKPSEDGGDYVDSFTQIILRRLRWQARMANGRELVSLIGATASVMVVLGFLWQQFVA